MNRSFGTFGAAMKSSGRWVSGVWGWTFAEPGPGP